MSTTAEILPETNAGCSAPDAKCPTLPVEKKPRTGGSIPSLFSQESGNWQA